MAKFEDAESQYVPLNNLDSFDDRVPPTTFEQLLDPLPVETTAEEVFTELSASEQRRYGFESFYDGLEPLQRQANLINYESLIKDPNLSSHDLVLGALRYAIAYVRRELKRPLSSTQMVDRVQNAALYLASVASGYDPSRGASFIGYVQKHMHWRVERLEESVEGRRKDNQIHQGDLIRVANANRAYYRIKNLRTSLEFKFGRSLELEEVALFGNFTNDEIEEYRELSVVHEPWSYEADLAEQPERLSYDNVAEFYRELPHDGLEKALAFLTPREQEVITARYGLDGETPMTLREIANTYEITHQAVQQTEQRALKKLRAAPNIIDLLLGVDEQPIKTA